MEKTYPWVDSFLDSLVLTSHKVIATRLKARFDEMKDVYDEIERQMRPLRDIEKSHSVDGILWAIIEGAANYSADGAKRERQRMKDIKKLHADLIETTRKLVKLLSRFSEIQTEGRVLSGAYIDVIRLMKQAGRGDHIFDREIKPLLDKVSSKGVDHYPGFEDILESLISEISDSEPYPKTDEDAAALYSQKASALDFVRFFLTRLQDEKRVGVIPGEFILTSKSIVIIANCALDLKDRLSESQISQARSTSKFFHD